MTDQTFHRNSPGFSVVGLPLRTSNAEAFETIPRHWAAFRQHATEIAAATGGGDVYAVYAEHEHEGVDNLGMYTFLIGFTAVGEGIPTGLARVDIPTSDRVELWVGRPEEVGNAWQAIWQRGDLSPTFVADVEHYLPDGTVRISIGVRSTP